eukprot:SAG31_NODE_1932_length_6879_cov_123.069322_4_plen_210_part_00
MQAFAIEHGFDLCEPWELQPELQTPAWAGRPAEEARRMSTCVGEETVHALVRLQDEEDHLGLFERIYPAGDADTYDRYWVSQPVSVSQRLTALWIKAGHLLDRVDEQDNGSQESYSVTRQSKWLADLKRPDDSLPDLGLLPVAPAVANVPAPAPLPSKGSSPLTPTEAASHRQTYEQLRSQLQQRAALLKKDTPRPPKVQLHPQGHDGV